MLDISYSVRFNIAVDSSCCHSWPVKDNCNFLEIITVGLGEEEEYHCDFNNEPLKDTLEPIDEHKTCIHR